MCVCRVAVQKVAVVSSARKPCVSCLLGISGATALQAGRCDLTASACCMHMPGGAQSSSVQCWMARSTESRAQRSTRPSLSGS
jgi:hypothetical protein